MTEIEELRQKIDQLESLVMSLMASSGEEETGAAGAPSAADCDYATPAEFDHEVVWDDQSSTWAVRYSTNTFTYGGKTCEPENLNDGLVPVAAGATVSIYGHAKISLADDGSVSSVDSLTYDTDPTGVTEARPNADDSSSDDTLYYDFLVATIEDSVVYQNLTGALHVGSASASMPTVDDVSLGYVEAEDDEDGESEQENVLQIKNFDSDGSNGSQGLCERISVVKDGDGYKLRASSGSDVWILARVNGALKYIPLTGSEDPDPDESQDDSDSCHDHPGDTEGVTPSTDSDHGGGVSSTDGSPATSETGSSASGVNTSGTTSGNTDENERFFTRDGEEVVPVSPDSEQVYDAPSGDTAAGDVTSGGVEPSGGEGHSKSACGDCN